MYWRVKSADPLRRYIPPFILSLHIITLMTRICLAVTFSTTSQYHIANLSSIFVQQISLKISFHSIKSTLYRFLRTPERTEFIYLFELGRRHCLSGDFNNVPLLRNATHRYSSAFQIYLMPFVYISMIHVVYYFT